MTFQENLRYYRKKAGYAQAKDFAAAIGVPYTTYIGYESYGKEPRYKTLCRIADALHVTTDELLGFEFSDFDKCFALIADYGFDIVDDDGHSFTVVREAEPDSGSYIDMCQYTSRNAFVADVWQAFSDARRQSREVFKANLISIFYSRKEASKNVYNQDDVP